MMTVSRPFGGKNRDISDGTPEHQFVSQLVNRFDYLDNLVWVVAEEYSEAHSVADASRIAEIIKQEDDRGHAVAVHQLNGIDFDFANDPNVDHFAIQSNTAESDIHTQMVQAFELADGGYGITMSESSEHYDPANPDRAATRKYSWAAAMGGAYVMVLRMDIMNTPMEILEDHGRMVQFFETTNFGTTSPRDELAWGSTEFVLANPGESYILYSSQASSDLGINIKRGFYNLYWFDPATGESRLEVRKAIGGRKILENPGLAGDELVVWIYRNRRPNFGN